MNKNKHGFTIVELLTVISIIVLLIAILAPSTSMAWRYALDVKQKVQINNIATALELFRNKFDNYPPSKALNKAGYDEIDNLYPGATRLCEALVGQDLLGFHPASRFRADCTDGTAPLVQLCDNPKGSMLPVNLQTNLRARKGPYLQAKRVNAYRLNDVYGDEGTGELKSSLFVLCDEYACIKNKSTGKRIGMPILYYRADGAGIRHDVNNLPKFNNDVGQFYNYLDNDYIVGLGVPRESTITHPLYNDPKKFYEETLNPMITINVGRPYNPDSYILLSAGFDGLYGTPDDVFNFER